MSLLESFQSPPEEGKFIVGEHNNIIISVDDHKEDLFLKTMGLQYPQILITDEILKKDDTDTSKEERLMEIEMYEEWRINGISGVLTNFSKIEANNKVLELFTSTCSYALQSLNTAIAFKNFCMPRSITDVDELFSEISPNRDWMNSRIRDIAWHRSITKVAVALRNDTILVYEAMPVNHYDKRRAEFKNAVLKGITSMIWSPSSSSQLVVGCKTGTFVFDTSLGTLRAASGDEGNVQDDSYMANLESTLMIKNHGLAPVSSVSWSREDDEIVCASPASGYIQTLNSEKKVKYHWITSDGINVVRYSPDNQFIAIATRVNTMLVVHAKKMEISQTFKNLNGTVKCMEWSANSKNLMFTLQNDHNLYGVSVLATNEKGIRTYDLSSIFGPHGEILGGAIQCMQWDPTSKKIAVLFKENSKLVALFNVEYVPKLMTYNLLAGSFIRCRESENINFMNFQVTSNTECVLTLVRYVFEWSVVLDTGLIRYVPLFDAEMTGATCIIPKLTKSDNLFPTLDHVYH